MATVEKAATAKIFFETHYNKLLTAGSSPRSLRRRELEHVLYDETMLSPEDKDNVRRAWAKEETNHLRETRQMKSQGPPKYEIVKVNRISPFLLAYYLIDQVLGKGSFGVVRLVREKVDKG